jgi:5-(carboxyamino)imidazole ribonucleotide synthase
MKKNAQKNTDRKLGILGGGQLGKMLALDAARWNIDLYMLDKDHSFPAAPYCPNFRKGNFKDFDDVLKFGREVDILSIEIEAVNTEALHQLVVEGKIVHPDPGKLDIIKDKGKQKSFYRINSLPTSYFELFDGPEAIRKAVEEGKCKLPFVQKSRTEGYDGRGVKIIRTEKELEELLPSPSVIEELVDIEKELAVIAARNEKGEIKTFPVVEMEFNPDANLVEFLFAPASIDEKTASKAAALARDTIKAFDLCGLLAVELFLTRSGEILINEVAPRTHNSGHHTIESAETSQFEQQLRAILNLPLGDTRLLTPAVMVNLLGEPGHTGPAYYKGMEEALAIPGVHIHLYGKKETRPFRKMGHVTITDPDLEEAKRKAREVQLLLKVEAKEG